MSIVFADSSAIVKRYVAEIGSAWVNSWIVSGSVNDIFVSALAIVEVVATLARRQRDGNLSASDRLRLENDFLIHLQNQYHVIPLDQNLLNSARRLTAIHPLRSLDAIQLACALAAAKALGINPTFISADKRLLIIAAAEGLPTDDPNSHP